MSDRTEDGGPAFAIFRPANTEGYCSMGMSLRDWFAGQALAGWMTTYPEETSTGDIDETSAKYIGEMSYRIADAMLAARKAAVE